MIRDCYIISLRMELLVEEFNAMIDKKNKEIEEKFLLKTKKTSAKIESDNQLSHDDISCDNQNDNIEKIDYTTKKTIYKINAEQERKYKASKAYKKSTAFSNI